MTIEVSSLKELVEQASGDDRSPDTQEYFVNMGPQHPSTHGVLRLVLKLDGERVLRCIPVLGYIHRSIEKISEHMNYMNCVHLTDRMDYLSSIMNNWAVSKAVEEAAGIEVNSRIQYIRTIFAELERIQSHQLWWGVLGMDLGAFTPFLYGIRDREVLNDVMEETVGARLTMNYVLPGGLMADIHPNFVHRVKEFIKYFRPKLDEYDDLLTNNVIIQERLRNVGVLSAQTAVQYGATGPVLRGSGVAFDLRKDHPYGVYDQADFEVPVGTVGDSWDRYWVRVEEMRQSLNIVEQLLDNIPPGDFLVKKLNSKIKIPEGRYYSQLETARGILGVFIASDKKDEPYRMHYRSPNFNNLWCLEPMIKGDYIASLIGAMSSLDLVIPDIDR
ncbi:NAD(P)H-quinone oxidoreductase subunit H [Stieleria neptunia]|uniref:NADH-quinone oxidoreductase subunit D n=1 Tax=Stieleria neptunia TaxID=2527979 RepID=A0A518HNJ8_9BACT|nr:NADH-quinone oxidoreductase subunit D [Stieleria neptunia]QDV42424.1 NAD(P)H-quinone oxidoreductase subunit H [Stieleria neptunia]